MIASVCAIAAPARAEEGGRPLRFNTAADLSVTGALATYMLVSELALKKHLAPTPAGWDDRGPKGVDALNPLDRQGYRLKWEQGKTAARISDVGLGVSLASALGLGALAAHVDGDGAARIGENSIIVAESTLAAMAINQTTKFLAGRQRPCAHYGVVAANDPGPCGPDRWDENLSSFSGHTTFAATLMASSGTVASMRGYRLAPLVWSTGALLTLSTAYLRIAASKHYVSDVLIGAAVGSAVGALLPLVLHGPEERASTATITAPFPRATPAAMMGFSGVF